MSLVKNVIREILIVLRLDVTKNLKYDRLTRIILKRHVSANTNCVDIGCHKGEILDLMLKYSPSGRHYAFEPVPYLFEGLKKKYTNKASVFPYALSDASGTTTFQLVKNAPAYSGIKKRKYDIADPIIEEIQVTLKTLDEVIPETEKIHLVKIDVEGAEMGVLKGAIKLLNRDKPLIIFECGKGATEFYGTTPAQVFDFLSGEIGLNIFTLESFIHHKPSLTRGQFEHSYESGEDYYFVASV